MLVKVSKIFYVKNYFLLFLLAKVSNSNSLLVNFIIAFCTSVCRGRIYSYESMILV